MSAGHADYVEFMGIARRAILTFSHRITIVYIDLSSGIKRGQWGE